MQSSHHRRSGILIGAVLSLAPTIFIACSTSTPVDTSKGAAAPAMSLTDGESSPPGIKWGPAPAVFPPGAKMAVIQGNPGASEPFVVQLRFPSNYTIAPHTHPTDEHVTVIAGTFKVGMGESFDEAAMTALAPGASVTAPALHAHYAKAVGLTTVQVSAMGPFALTYVNPDDLPQQARR
jgi:quercetin dioxygenase-like cupin family protein